MLNLIKCQLSDHVSTKPLTENWPKELIGFIVNNITYSLEVTLCTLKTMCGIVLASHTEAKYLVKGLLN